MYQSERWIPLIALCISIALCVWFARFYVRYQNEAYRKNCLDDIYREGVAEGEIQARHDLRKKGQS